MAESALVTGGNRGLGLECCRQLARHGFSVLLGSRNSSGGEAAAAGLRQEGLDVEAWALDVTSPASIEALARRLAERGRPLHALVNNAAVLLQGSGPGDAEQTLATNYFGAVSLSERLLPQIPAGGRVVMVSSAMGELRALAPGLRRQFLDAGLDRAALDELMSRFVESTHGKRPRADAWPSGSYAAYSVSKVGLNSFVRLRAPALAARGVLLNAVCPGWVRTRMGGRSAPRGIPEGAASIVWAATLPADGPTGGFFRDGQRIDW